MDVQTDESDIEFKKLRWYYKYTFEKWKLISNNKKSKRNTFAGVNGGQDNIDTSVIIKQIPINENNYAYVLKEVYFLACCKRNKYFIEIIDAFLSKDCKNLYIIFRGEGCDLGDNIRFNKFNINDSIPNISHIILFRIVSGLYILNKEGLSHNDIKLSNIILSENGEAKICDMGSTDIIGKRKYGGTNGYSSPQCLLGRERTKEDDMYSVGIVFLELLKNKNKLFYIPIPEQMQIEEENGNDILEKKNEYITEKMLKQFYDIRYIGEQFWNTGINYNIVINQIKLGVYNDLEFRLKDLEYFNNIDIQEKTLIRNLLEINPANRKTAEQVLNLPMFKELNYKFINSKIDYSLEDYNKFFGKQIITQKTFKKHLETIRQKFIGKEIFIKNIINE